MSARLSVAPPFSPRLIQAWKIFSRRSRRDGELQKGLARRARQRDGIFAGVAALLGRRARGGAGEVGQAGEIALLQHERVSLLVRQHVLPELGAEARQPLVDRREPVLRRLVERSRRPARNGCGSGRARAPARRLRPSALAPAVELGDAGVERAVEIERVAVAGEQRRDVALDRLDGVAGVGAGQHEEHVGDTVEVAPAPLQRHDGVVEARRRRVGGDRVDLGTVRGERRDRRPGGNAPV